MAKELENEKRASKLEAKREQAEAMKKELAEQINDLKIKILDEKDDKAKAQLRKQRDELIAKREAIVIENDKVKIPMDKPKKKRIQACIAIVVVIALLVTYVATGAARHGILGSIGIPQKTLTGMTITDREGEKHSIKVSTYNYYYAVNYNSLQQTYSYLAQLGQSTDVPDFDKSLSKQTREDEDGNKQTWADYLDEQVMNAIQTTYAYYYAAVKANDGKEPEIKDSQQEELDETISTYQESADNYHYSLNAYLKAAMGDGINEEVVRREMKISYISSNYKDDYNKELTSKEFSEEEYNAYLDEHRDELLSVDVRYFECASEDEAKAFVDALNDDASNFAELASQYSEDDFDKELNLDPVETTYIGMTKDTLEGIGAAIAQAEEAEEEEDSEEEEEHEHVHVYPGFDWLFSEDRKAGDVTNYSTSVVYVIKPAYLSDVHPVTVRHILILPQNMLNDEEESEEETTTATTAEEATEEQWAAAEAKAQEVLDEYLAGDKTADSFAALAKEYSEDGNADDGGIYENVTPCTMVPTFNAWIFDSSRQAGDTAVVKTEFGYHVMYFESSSELTTWQYTAQQALASEGVDEIIEEFEDSYSIKKAWPGSCFFQKDTDLG